MLQNGADLGSVGAVGQTEPTCLEEEPVQDTPAQDLHAADSVPQAVLEQKLTAHTPLTERERERESPEYWAQRGRERALHTELESPDHWPQRERERDLHTDINRET